LAPRAMTSIVIFLGTISQRSNLGDAAKFSGQLQINTTALSRQCPP
jgi:hypothetical protein